MVRKVYVLVAMLYPLLAVAAFALTVRTDPFAIFAQGYSAVWLLFIPAALILLAIGLAFTGRAPRSAWRLALVVWIALVTYGHYAQIGIAAAGV